MVLPFRCIQGFWEQTGIYFGKLVASHVEDWSAPGAPCGSGCSETDTWQWCLDILGHDRLEHPGTT